MYNKILVPVDGSKLAECTFGHLEEIAGGCQVKDIILLTVLETPNFPFVEYWSQAQIEEIIRQQEKAEEAVKEKAEKYLAGAVEYLKNRGVSAHSVLIKPDVMKSTADVILDYAEKNNIDLIIISTHGRSGIARWAFGSVADRIVRYSVTPVLTVAPKGCRVVPQQAPLP
jgi:nucleotide-binding universal stress UspA family protein